ncbi:MAG: hypothetical protein ACXVCL_04985 [Bdellovibrio sp.]
MVITERFATDQYGSTNNDYQLATGRFFFKATECGDSLWDFTFDLRDKYDSFGQLNREQLTLEGKNEFQARQLSAKWPNKNGSVSFQIGRFQLPEAGAVFTDGIETEYRTSPEWRTGIFGGYNPKSIEQSYLEFNPDALEAGIFSTYQSFDGGWDKNLYFSHGFVQQTYKSQPERSFFFHTLLYQWESMSRIISYLNYDFVPSSKIQTANILYQQNFSPEYSAELGYLKIDVIEYRRKQGLLEKLNPSPYSEYRFQMRRNSDYKSQTALELSSGLREVDNLKKTEILVGYSQSELFSKNVDFRFKIGHRKNFTSNDTFSYFALGYFSRNWEYSIDGQYEVDNNDNGIITHPVTLEIAISRFYSREIFLTGSFQRAADENVTIMSAFLKIGYRFGNQEIPPIRDGASPRGPL